MKDIRIKDCESGDFASWRALWDEYLAFYKVSLPDEVTAATWARLMDAGSPVKARLAVSGGQVVGFAIHHHHASTWVMADDCYLEDLFVDASARGCGAGRMLLQDVIDLARARGWGRVYWHTDEGNTRARALYDSFAPYDGHVRYRLKL
jgi:GNAT superfamily N-acetyltransferase